MGEFFLKRSNIGFLPGFRGKNARVFIQEYKDIHMYNHKQKPENLVYRETFIV